MPNTINTVCRKCRREGAKLFLKGERCFTPKCGFTRRSYAPGSHVNTRAPKLSDYGKQLREKQKAKAIYRIRERQFHNYYKKASKTKAATGEKLMQLLETRLDHVVFSLGFANSIRQSRQMISHKKFAVNNKKINIPSYLVKVGDKIEPRHKKDLKINKTEVPLWLKLDKNNLTGEVIKIPSRTEIKSEIDEGLIVEFYSR